MHEPLVWSDVMRRLWWRHSGNLIRNDPRTDWRSENWDECDHLGFPSRVVREEVIEEGLADFSIEYRHPQHGLLTPEDRVNLYCFLNLRHHFFTSLSVFHEHSGMLQEWFGGRTQPVMLDVGCGPATSAMALAELHQQVGDQPLSLDYIGVDRAPAMRRKARELMIALTDYELLTEQSTFRVLPDWLSLTPLFQRSRRKRRVLLNFSYFFASRSIDGHALDSLSKVVQTIVSAGMTENIWLVHINSPIHRLNRSFRAFLQRLGVSPKLSRRTIHYKNRPLDENVRSVEFVHQVVKLK